MNPGREGIVTKTQHILTLNGGSSIIKLSLCGVSTDEHLPVMDEATAEGTEVVGYVGAEELSAMLKESP